MSPAAHLPPLVRPDSTLVYDLEQQLLEKLHTEVARLQPPVQVLLPLQIIAHGHETTISTVGMSGVLHESVYSDRWRPQPTLPGGPSRCWGEGQAHLAGPCKYPGYVPNDGRWRSTSLPAVVTPSPRPERLRCPPPPPTPSPWPLVPPLHHAAPTEPRGDLGHGEPRTAREAPSDVLAETDDEEIRGELEMDEGLGGVVEEDDDFPVPSSPVSCTYPYPYAIRVPQVPPSPPPGPQTSQYPWSEGQARGGEEHPPPLPPPPPPHHYQ